MTFFLDENFPRSSVKLLREFGQDVIDARDVLPAGSEDSLVLETARASEAVLLTTDRDFFHTLSLEDTEHTGIVVIALRQPNRARILSRLRWFLEFVSEDQIAGYAYQLRDTTYIVRPPVAQ